MPYLRLLRKPGVLLASPRQPRCRPAPRPNPLRVGWRAAAGLGPPSQGGKKGSPGLPRAGLPPQARPWRRLGLGPSEPLLGWGRLTPRRPRGSASPHPATAPPAGACPEHRPPGTGGEGSRGEGGPGRAGPRQRDYSSRRPSRPPRSRPAPRAQPPPFEPSHGGRGGGGGAAARGMAALFRSQPRQHFPELALHRGLRLHARAGEPGEGAGPGGSGAGRNGAGADGPSRLPSARRWRRRVSCTAPARTAPTWRSASSASRSWRAGSPTTTLCE